MVGIRSFPWDGLFSVVMLASGSVNSVRIRLMLMIQESPLEIGSEQLFDLIEAPFTYAWQTSDSIQFARRLSKHKN